MNEDDIEQAIAAKASEVGIFAVAYALLRLAKALNVRPLRVEELDKDIADVFLFSQRTLSALYNNDIMKVRDLEKISEDDLRKPEGVGEATRKEIKAQLA